jgi:hypothetical protein
MSPENGDRTTCWFEAPDQMKPVVDVSQGGMTTCVQQSQGKWNVTDCKRQRQKLTDMEKQSASQADFSDVPLPPQPEASHSARTDVAAGFAVAVAALVALWGW